METFGQECPEVFVYNSIKQLTTVMHCYILFVDGGETYAYYNQ